MRVIWFSNGVLACLFLALSASASGADPTLGTLAKAGDAKQCLSDLRDFDSQMRQDGYWLDGTGFDFGDYVDGAFPAGQTSAGYLKVKPAYQIDHLFTAANILGAEGLQDACSAVLAETRQIYSRYILDLRSGYIPRIDREKRRQGQITSAHPVNDGKTGFRVDHLIGSAVRSPDDRSLGSVQDVVINPETDKVAYLMLASGRIFSPGETLTPVPWQDFDATSTYDLLVLDASASSIAAAPKIDLGRYTSPAGFDQQRLAVDDYWKSRIGSAVKN